MKIPGTIIGVVCKQSTKKRDENGNAKLYSQVCVKLPGVGLYNTIGMGDLTALEGLDTEFELLIRSRNGDDSLDIRLPDAPDAAELHA